MYEKGVLVEVRDPPIPIPVSISILVLIPASEVSGIGYWKSVVLMIQLHAL